MSEPLPVKPPQSLTGQEIGDFRVLRPIGSGGMAEVYLAQQASLGRQVALKVLHRRLAGDASYVARFLNEARAAATLVHPNIVQIYEVGEVAGIHFIAQEYVPGKNLAEVIERQGALQPDFVLDVLRQVVSALCKANELGIIHRDIKPENILVSHSGEVKVADFGLARVTGSDNKTVTKIGVAMGTPLYMSPEQIEGRKVDARSDIYSLGVTSYHLLTGLPPYVGETALAIAVQHVNSVPKPLEDVRHDLPRGLTRLVHHMLSKNPESRPASAQQLLSDLRHLAGEAEQTGWAKGLGTWSLAEGIAPVKPLGPNGQQLGELMQAASRLQLPRRKWARLAVGLVGAAILGVALGAWTRPRFLLTGPSSPYVPAKPTAAAQLYHARVVDSEAAWLVALEYKDIDPFLRQLARKGLIRCYLLVLEDDRSALGQLQQFSEPDKPSVRRFILAAQCIAHARLGNVIQARAANQAIDSSMRAELHRQESQIFDLWQASLQRL
ncbi:MAG: serine/threonine protein kinase [Pirellulales bacterium]|nr:serine/threonine protein kinase [Pirellulales bacterium]